MKQPVRPHPGSRMVDRVPVNGKLQDWPSNTVRYISRSWRGPVYIQAEGVDFNLRYVAVHEHAGHGRYPLHFHPHSEILLTIQGSGVIETIPGKRIIPCEPGDLVVMPPRSMHQSKWAVKSEKPWQLLMIDYDLALDIARLPLEEGDKVDLGFTPFFEWFYQRDGVHVSMRESGWDLLAPVVSDITRTLAGPEYGAGAELLAGTLRLIAAFSRELRTKGLADGRHPTSALFSKQSALLKARTLMEHRGWFDPGCVGRLAREVGIAETHFTREFQSAFGMSPKKYSQQVLMRRASALLTGSDLPVRDIAGRLGYEDPSIFSRAFRKAMGMSPAHYRQHAKTRP